MRRLQSAWRGGRLKFTQSKERSEMQVLATTLMRACAVIGIACWAAALFYMFRTVYLRKPGVKLWRGLDGGPFNLLLEADNLTDAGLIARRRCFYSMCGFVGTILFAMAVGTIAGL